MKFLITFLSLIAINLSVFSQVGVLIWEDNFNEGHLDLNKWRYETGTGVNGDWGTGQLDRATSRPENVSFQDNVPGAEDACLVITTREEFYIDRNYTSGRINTSGKASWGPGHRIVAKVLPRDVRQKGQGFAFWTMPDEIPEGWDWIMWPQGGEVDIMEYVGSIPYHNLGGVHYAWFWMDNEWVDWNHGHLAYYYSFENEEVPNPPSPGYGGYPPPANDPNSGSSAFHTYGIDWYSNRMEFFVDDNVYHIHYFEDGDAYLIDGEDQKLIQDIDGRRVGVSEYSNHFEEWYPFEHKMFVILSGGVGGSQYTYGGSIVPQAEFPCSVFIDWVRVYTLDEDTKVENFENKPNIILYPNPTNGELHIKIESPQEYNVRIINRSGRVLVNASLSQSQDLDISSLNKGAYIVLLSNDKITLSEKIILQ